MMHRWLCIVTIMLGLSTIAAGRLEKPFNDDLIDCSRDIEECFEHWMLYYEQNYTMAETQVRFKVFKENVEYVSERMKGEALCHYRLGLNVFAATTREEFDKTHLGGFLTEFKANISYAAPPPGGAQRRLLDFQEHRKLVATLPATVDWRTKGVVNPIRDQYPCSGCYAFATVAAVESFVAINTGRLPQLSEKGILNCCLQCPCCGSACAGGYIESAFDFAKGSGLVSETLVPFVEPIERTCPVAPGEKRKTFIDDYQVKYYPQLTEADIMALVSKQPVVVYFYADTEFETRWYKGGVYTGPCTNRPSTGNHFMTIVGYGYDSEARKNYWLVRNSWGTSWGEDGYIKILRGPGATGDGVCGIQYLAAWPIQKNPAPAPVVPRRRKGRKGMRGMKGGMKGRKGMRPKGGNVAAPIPAPAPVAALKQCLFFFKGSSSPETAPVPVVRLKELGDHTYDMPIAAYNERTKSVVEVHSANSNQACSDNGVRKPGAPPFPSCHFVFQFSGDLLSTKSFNDHEAYKSFTSQAYIKIPITGAQLAGDVNLNKGDGNTDFPESRRCVVFIPEAA